MTAAPVSAQAVPPAIYEMTVAIGIADHIAGQCSRLRFDRQEEHRLMREVSASLTAEGQDVTALGEMSDLLAAAMLMKYWTEHGVLSSDPESACRAGFEEIANGTSIGRLLVAAGDL
jgi:hypothetical protein